MYIDGKPIKIKWEQKLGQLSQGYGLAGLHNGSHIKMGVGLTRNQKRATLFHELMHEIWARANMSQRFTKKQEEDILSGIDIWIVSMLRENPKLVQFLTEED